MFGSFALRANSLGHLEQIESYAPGHQVRFGSLNYTTDIRGDLIFDGFEPLPCASRGHGEYDLALPSDSIQEITPAAAPTLNSEPVAPSMDGWIDHATEALPSAAIEPNIDLNLYESRVVRLPDPSPATDSEPPAPIPSESDWDPIMEFTSADIFQHSPFGDILNSLRCLSLSGGSWPNYVRQDWDADDKEIRCPPTTHLVAIVDELTYMLNFESEDIDCMDDDAGDE